MTKRWSGPLSVALLCAVTLAAASRTVTLALDWTPNTNHTGIYAAAELGFFSEEGLAVEIVQPSPGTSIPLTGSGNAHFGVSMQEDVTVARAEGIPFSIEELTTSVPPRMTASPTTSDFMVEASDPLSPAAGFER